MSALLDKLKASGTIKSVTISESKIFDDRDVASTRIPIINVAFTGELSGGIVGGLNIVAGDSKTFKSNICLICIHAYMKKHPDSVCLFYDSEFGITPEYITAHGIDKDRVIHLPITTLEDLTFDIAKRLQDIKRNDKVIIFVDSIGNLASIKEATDAEEGNDAADMSRPKKLKSFFRIVTPHLTLKDIPMLVVGHTYDEQKMYGKTILSGGKGAYYSANNIFFITRSQEKDGTEVVGYNFTINIEKSRLVKEKSQLKFLVTFDGGIDRFSGLLDLSLELGFVKKPSNGWYSRVDIETGEIEDKKYREADTHNTDFWKPILSNKKFHEMVKDKFKLAVLPMMSLDEGE